MVSKGTVVTAAGALVGVVAAPYVMGMIGIQQSSGFGMDDVVAALIIVVAIMLVHAIF